MAAADNRERSVGIPASYIGTTGKLTLAIYGFCPATGFTTDVQMSVTTTDGTALGQVSIVDVPLQRNRATQYSGQLFTDGGTASLLLNSEWNEPYVATW